MVAKEDEKDFFNETYPEVDNVKDDILICIEKKIWEKQHVEILSVLFKK